MIAKFDTVSASPHQVYTTLGSETVVLEFQAGTYFGMDEVGTAVWNFLQQSRQVADVIEYVASNYEVSAEVAETEILGFLQNLVEKGLLVIEKTSVR
jgi:hypothetical protein